MAKNQSEEMEKKNPFKSQIENLETFKFSEENPEYTGVFVKKNELVNKEGKRFTLNVFADPLTGEQIFIGDNYSIERAIAEAKEEHPKTDIVFKIHFLGKTIVNGKPFSRFKIETAPLQEYLDFIQ
jgi:hypothetical protein